MLTEEQIAQEFVRVVTNHYPRAGNLLQQYCHVKIVTAHWGHFRQRFQRQSPKRFRYICVYCPEQFLSLLEGEKDVLREVAKDMDLTEVVCLNANRLLHDPRSPIKEADPKFWLELHWVTSNEETFPPS
jgi:hypothetical protein